jgi:hypothetical protein
MNSHAAQAAAPRRDKEDAFSNDCRGLWDAFDEAQGGLGGLGPALFLVFVLGDADLGLDMVDVVDGAAELTVAGALAADKICAKGEGAEPPAVMGAVGMGRFGVKTLPFAPTSDISDLELAVAAGGRLDAAVGSFCGPARSS